MGKIMKAVIFDMDGVISDSQPIHAELEELLLKEHGIYMTAADLTKEYAGVPDRQCAEIIFAKHGKEVDLDKFVENKWRKIMEFAKGRVVAIEGVLDLIQNLRANNFRLAIASSSKPEFIDLIVGELKIKDKFDAITAGTEVEKGKPSPDIFLLAAKKLGVDPAGCTVIEDAKHGVQAAKRAGMRCVWLNSAGQSGQNEYPADITVKSLKELKIEDFV